MKRIIFICLIFAGCGTIRETTTTETMDVNVPPESQSQTKYIPIYIPPSEEYIDSIKQWTLITFCKGEIELEKGNLKSVTNFYTRLVKSKEDTIKGLKSKLAIVTETKTESKEHTIQGEKKIEETKSTPGNIWILFHSWQFTIPAFILGALIVILIGRKTTLLKNIL
jgi:hypothetical protein